SIPSVATVGLRAAPDTRSQRAAARSPPFLPNGTVETRELCIRLAIVGRLGDDGGVGSVPPRRQGGSGPRTVTRDPARPAGEGPGGATETSSKTRGGQPGARGSPARPLPAGGGAPPVFERTLANGFKALVPPRQHAPVVVCDLYYPAGSVDEPPGKS